ncbi:hypothetical protein TNCV_3722281 [Trichonephila clavipes]|nr:hypothetical protein TNCV_3722281 [Trichonephila clavipes]
MTGEHLSDCQTLLHVLSEDNCGVILPDRATSALYWTARRLMSERTFVGPQHMLLLPWPAYSQDMSSIEHVWDFIGRLLARDPSPAASRDEMLLCI